MGKQQGRKKNTRPSLTELPHAVQTLSPSHSERVQPHTHLAGKIFGLCDERARGWKEEKKRRALFACLSWLWGPCRCFLGPVAATHRGFSGSQNCHHPCIHPAYRHFLVLIKGQQSSDLRSGPVPLPVASSSEVSPRGRVSGALFHQSLWCSFLSRVETTTAAGGLIKPVVPGLLQCSIINLSRSLPPSER